MFGEVAPLMSLPSHIHTGNITRDECRYCNATTMMQLIEALIQENYELKARIDAHGAWIRAQSLRILSQ